MIRSVMMTIVILSGISKSAIGMESNLNPAALSTYGDRYVSFLREVGQADSTQMITVEKLATLFSEDIRKVECGNEIATGISGLQAQLKSVKKKLATWEVSAPFFNIPSQHLSAVTLQFVWKAATLKQQYTTMAILWFNAEGKITRIHEVFNVYQDTPLHEKK